ncbi:MAG: RNA pyrophosphohydrolase [Chitinispirillia bacterium]|jgi:putative (di)nucleoside polyphosphate hydrolase
MGGKKYRPNVCAVIKRKIDNSILLCHRKGFKPFEGWQFPQGGIDTQKNLVDELKRELLEEIGINDIVVIKILPKYYFYDFPLDLKCGKYHNYRGQKQKWILVELQTDNIKLPAQNDNAEFDDYQWVKPYEAILRIVDFKKEIYKQALDDLKLI